MPENEPEMPSELWMLWDGRSWVRLGSIAYIACGSRKDAQAAADDLSGTSDIRCTPIRVDQPERIQIATLETKIAPPLFEFPNGEFISPFVITGIVPFDSFSGDYPRVSPRVIMQTGKDGSRSSSIVQWCDTFEEAQQVARDLGRRINEARKGTQEQ